MVGVRRVKYGLYRPFTHPFLKGVPINPLAAARGQVVKVPVPLLNLTKFPGLLPMPVPTAQLGDVRLEDATGRNDLALFEAHESGQRRPG